jgi:hypothetical protein
MPLPDLPRYRDGRGGIRHTAEVQTETRYEAGSPGDSGPQVRQVGRGSRAGNQTRVEVREPVIRHTVTVKQLQRWTESPATSPAERLRREQVKGMLGVEVPQG